MVLLGWTVRAIHVPGTLVSLQVHGHGYYRILRHTCLRVSESTNLIKVMM